MRKSFSKSQCEEILENQDGNCKKCGVRFFGKNKVRPQYDHINGDHSDNRVANGQAICANCHDVKSRKQNVQRSIQEQDINFVKRCPLCNHKTRWKDYDLKNEPMTEENRKIISNSEYIMAGWQFLCYDCKSILKVIRVDSKKPRKSKWLLNRWYNGKTVKSTHSEIDKIIILCVLHLNHKMHSIIKIRKMHLSKC